MLPLSGREKLSELLQVSEPTYLHLWIGNTPTSWDGCMSEMTDVKQLAPAGEGQYVQLSLAYTGMYGPWKDLRPESGLLYADASSSSHPGVCAHRVNSLPQFLLCNMRIKIIIHLILWIYKKAKKLLNVYIFKDL